MARRLYGAQNFRFDPASEGVFVTQADGNAIDPFGWSRTSSRVVAFEYAGQYDQGLLLWEHSLSGTGSVTFEPATGANTLSTGGTASGAKAIRQTHEYHLYLPGRGRLSVSGFIFGSETTNLRRRHGLFDDSNGLFLEQTSTGIRFVTRSSVSGSPVDTLIERADWSIDRFDETGPSGIRIDLTKAQALIIDCVGYNAAKVRFGFLLEGRIWYAHEVNNLNALTSFALSTMSLPLRYEIENTGVTSGTNTMRASSCVIYNEDGGSVEIGYQFTASMGTTTLGVTTRRPVLSIQPKATFNSITNRGHVHLQKFAANAKTNDAFFELVRNGTLTGAAFASAGANSITNFDTTATAITGGDIIDSGHILSGTGSTSEGMAVGFLGRLALTNNFAGTTPDILTLVMTAMTGTATVSASMTFEEQR